MNLFRVNTIVNLDPAAGEPIDLGGVQGTVIRGGECWISPNWAGWPLVVNSQQSTIEEPVYAWQLPDNVAMRFAPGERMMLQVHYVNASTQETPFRGRAGVNFTRSTNDTVEMGSLFATQQSIRICRSTPPPVYSGSCTMPTGDHRVAAVNGHFHSRGQRFSVYAWDGVSTTRPLITSDAESFASEFESANQGSNVACPKGWQSALSHRQTSSTPNALARTIAGRSPYARQGS
jgi:hypothetical protein